MNSDAIRVAIRRRQEYVVENFSDVGRGLASGSVWSGIRVASMTVIQFGRSAVFARLLAPAEFGEIALASIMTNFIFIFSNLGFRASLIHKKKLDSADLSSCWWGSVTIDTVVAAVCVVVGLFVSNYRDQTVVGHIIILLSIQFIFGGLSNVQLAVMQRQFMFRELTISFVAEAVISFGVGWFLVAHHHLGVYGVVVGLLAGATASTMIKFIYVPWLPRLKVSGNVLRGHLKFGRWFLGMNLVDYVNVNIDRALIGGLLTKTQLGFYEYAGSVPVQLTRQLGNALNGVMFPAFSAIRDKQDDFASRLMSVMRYYSMILFPMLIGLLLVAEDFVEVVYGERWLPIVDALRFFCMASVIQVIANPIPTICNSLGRPSLSFKWSAILLAPNALVLWLAVSTYGIAGAAAARSFIPIAMLLTLGVQTARIMRLRYDVAWRPFVPATIASATMALAVLGFRQLFGAVIQSSGVLLVLESGLGGVVYVGVLYRWWSSDVRFLLTRLQRLRKG